jgi:hypothetical protein
MFFAALESELPDSDIAEVDWNVALGTDADANIAKSAAFKTMVKLTQIIKSMYFIVFILNSILVVKYSIFFLMVIQQPL